MQYATLTLSELKVLAAQNNAIPTGDKRSKQSWIDAIELALQSTTEISDAKMECIAVAVDIAVATDIWIQESPLTQTVELAPEAPEPAAAVEEVLDCKSDKKGAATVLLTLLCTIVIIIRSTVIVTAAVIRACIQLGNMFGRYNPDYDLWQQLAQSKDNAQPSIKRFGLST